MDNDLSNYIGTISVYEKHMKKNSTSYIKRAMYSNERIERDAKHVVIKSLTDKSFYSSEKSMGLGKLFHYGGQFISSNLEDYIISFYGDSPSLSDEDNKTGFFHWNWYLDSWITISPAYLWKRSFIKDFINIEESGVEYNGTKMVSSKDMLSMFDGIRKDKVNYLDETRVSFPFDDDLNCGISVKTIRHLLCNVLRPFGDLEFDIEFNLIKYHPIFKGEFVYLKSPYFNVLLPWRKSLLKRDGNFMKSLYASQGVGNWYRAGKKTYKRPKKKKKLPYHKRP